MSLPNAEQFFAQLLARLTPALPPDATLMGLSEEAGLLLDRLTRQHPFPVLHFHADNVLSAGQREQLNATTVVLLDSVLGSGENVLKACHWLRQQGITAPIELAVLANRGGTTVPVTPTYCGGTVMVAVDVPLRLDKNATTGELLWRT